MWNYISPETAKQPETASLHSRTLWWKYGAVHHPAEQEDEAGMSSSLRSFDDPFCCGVQLEEVFHISFPNETSLLWGKRGRGGKERQTWFNCYNYDGLLYLSVSLRTQIRILLCHPLAASTAESEHYSYTVIALLMLNLLMFPPIS